MLAQHTDVLLLDEPTTFLDLAYQMDVLDPAGTHDLKHAARYVDTIVALRGGQIVVQGTAEEIMIAENIFQVFGLRSTIVTALDEKLSYAQYQLAQMDEYLDHALQRKV